MHQGETLVDLIGRFEKVIGTFDPSPVDTGNELIDEVYETKHVQLETAEGPIVLTSSAIISAEVSIEPVLILDFQDGSHYVLYPESDQIEERLGDVVVENESDAESIVTVESAIAYANSIIYDSDKQASYLHGLIGCLHRKDLIIYDDPNNEGPPYSIHRVYDAETFETLELTIYEEDKDGETWQSWLRIETADGTGLYIFDHYDKKVYFYPEYDDEYYEHVTYSPKKLEEVTQKIETILLLSTE